MAQSISLDDFWNSAPQTNGVFDPTQLTVLPDAAQRYLTHAIAPGTPLMRTVRLRMHGQIKLKSWLDFTAEEVIRWDRGMIWQATVKMSVVPIRGFDLLVDGGRVR